MIASCALKMIFIIPNNAAEFLNEKGKLAVEVSRGPPSRKSSGRLQNDRLINVTKVFRLQKRRTPYLALPFMFFFNEFFVAECLRPNWLQIDKRQKLKVHLERRTQLPNGGPLFAPKAIERPLHKRWAHNKFVPTVAQLNAKWAYEWIQCVR